MCHANFATITSWCFINEESKIDASRGLIRISFPIAQRPNPLVRKNEKWPLLLHLFQESQFEEQLSQHTFKRNWVIKLLHDP